GCRHAPHVTATTAGREQARIARLPGDRRPLDAHWDDLDIHASLRQGTATAVVVVDGLKVRMFNRPGPAGQPTQLSASGAQLRKLLPLDIERIAVHDGELDYVDATEPSRPELWIHDLELALENVT